MGKRKFIDKVCPSVSAPSSTPLIVENIYNEPCFSGLPTANSEETAHSTEDENNAANSNTIREISVNTDVSFSPYSDVSFSVTPTEYISNSATAPYFECPKTTEGGSENPVDDSDLSDDSTSSNDRSDYSSASASTSLECDVEEVEHHAVDDEHSGMKYIVFFSCLLPLLQCCLVCPKAATITKMCTEGTALCVKLLCTSKHGIPNH